MESTEFKVGEKYTNEKGVFEVISIKGDQMVIQWEDGEKITSEIELQRRIQDRRNWENQVREKMAASAAAKPRSAAAKAGATFEGLHADDFKNKISRTKWRSRGQLGGCVTTHLKSAHYKFNSWAAKRRNETHWADAGHWKKASTLYRAKFFARADEATLWYGFSIERPEAGATPSADWRAFSKWLSNEENDQWLRTAANEEQLTIFDASRACFNGVIEPGETDWAIEGVSTPATTAALAPLIDSWPDTARLELMIAHNIPKAEAIARAKEVAADIGKLFGRLFPLYDAAIAHMG